MLDKSLDYVLTKTGGACESRLIRIIMQHLANALLPPVTNITLPERSGRSLSAVKDVIALMECLVRR